MPSHDEFTMPCRVEDRVGNRGDVMKNPWKTYAGWFVTVMWDEDASPSAQGVTDERIDNLTVVR